MTGTVIDHGHADAVVSVSEAAALVGVTDRTVRRWIEAGEVQAETGKRGRLVSVSDVRKRAAGGPVRTFPRTGRHVVDNNIRTDADADMSALSTVLSPVLIAHAEQVERLTREAMTEKARADRAEQEIERLSAELLQALIQRSER